MLTSLHHGSDVTEGWSPLEAADCDGSAWEPQPLVPSPSWEPLLKGGTTHSPVPGGRASLCPHLDLCAHASEQVASSHYT